MMKKSIAKFKWKNHILVTNLPKTDAQKQYDNDKKIEKTQSHTLLVFNSCETIGLHDSIIRLLTCSRDYDERFYTSPIVHIVSPHPFLGAPVQNLSHNQYTVGFKAKRKTYSYYSIFPHPFLSGPIWGNIKP